MVHTARTPPLQDWKWSFGKDWLGFRSPFLLVIPLSGWEAWLVSPLGLSHNWLRTPVMNHSLTGMLLQVSSTSCQLLVSLSKFSYPRAKLLRASYNLRRPKGLPSKSDPVLVLSIRFWKLRETQRNAWGSRRCTEGFNFCQTLNMTYTLFSFAGDEVSL